MDGESADRGIDEYEDIKFEGIKSVERNPIKTHAFSSANFGLRRIYSTHG